MRPAISLRNVRKSFGDNAVLRDINLTVEPGSICALLGPNGAGKTTLINILTTLVKPDAGAVEVSGYNVLTEPNSVKQRMSLTGQSAAVDNTLTGRENLVMLGRLSGLSKLQATGRAAELLRAFDIEDAGDRRVATYSGGMRRRLDLSLGLVKRPAVIVLDEPTTGLDTRSRRELWGIIHSLRAEGTTVFLTTQYLEEADELADRVAVINDGIIVADDTPQHLKAQVGGHVLELRDASDAVRSTSPIDGTVGALRHALANVSAGDDRLQASLRRPSLDDVFFALTDTNNTGAADNRTANITKAGAR